jgi:hypothetical protein
MRNIQLMLVALAALMVFVGAHSSDIWAQAETGEQEAPRLDAKHPVAVEFSTSSNDVDCVHALDPLQVLHTQPPVNYGNGTVSNTFDYGLSGEVDALANVGDALFGSVINNVVTLLVSFEGDPGGNPVWYETPQGPVGVQWTNNNLDNAGVVLDGTLELDGLEVWGPPENDDANFYSMVGEPGGVSVYSYTGTSQPYINQTVIQAACVSLGYNGSVDVDLDALMVWDYGSYPDRWDRVWADGDKIIFSIRDTQNGGGNWDGGEIVVLPFGGPAAFLNHAGRTWNTAYDVSGIFGVATEEVDAIEAYWPPPDQTIPSLSEWGLIVLVVLLTTCAVFIMCRRRKGISTA